MRFLLVAITFGLAVPAQSAQSRLEKLFSETNRVVVEINAFDRSLQLNLTSFGQQGKSAAGSAKEAKTLRRKATTLLKRWDAPSKEWKKTPKERREQFKSMRKWLRDLRKTVLNERFKTRVEFEKAVKVCDLGKISASINALCKSGCSLKGYEIPCALRERKIALSLPMNREKLLGGKHRLGIEGGALTLQPHGIEELRKPLGKFWEAAYAAGIEKAMAGTVEAVRQYSNLIKVDSTRRATRRKAVERIFTVWDLHSHSDPLLLEADALSVAKRAYFEMTGEAASLQAASSLSGITSRAPARDAIQKILRAAGSARGASNADADSLLAANRSSESSAEWPVHSLKLAVARRVGSVDGVVVANDGTIVFSLERKPIRVIADPANGSFRVCRSPCGEKDFLTIDGESPIIRSKKKADKPKPKKKKKSWWFGGSDDEEEEKEDVPTLPTQFIIQELR